MKRDLRNTLFKNNYSKRINRKREIFVKTNMRLNRFLLLIRSFRRKKIFRILRLIILNPAINYLNIKKKNTILDKLTYVLFKTTLLLLSC